MCNFAEIYDKFLSLSKTYNKKWKIKKKCFNTASFRKINLSGVSVYMAACC